MPEMIDHVTIFWSYEDALSDVEDEEVELELRRAIMRYAFTGEEPELKTWMARSLFKVIRPNIDASRANVINGGKSKGNRNAKVKDTPAAAGPSAHDTPNVPGATAPSTDSIPEAYPRHTRGIPKVYQENTHGIAIRSKEKELGEGKGEGIGSGSDCADAPAPTPPDEPLPFETNPLALPDTTPEPAAKTKPKTRRFIPPNADEVREYAATLPNAKTFDADRFCDYYAANGWKAGKNPMKDWRAAVRNWIRRDNDNRPDAPRASPHPAQPTGPPVYTVDDIPPRPANMSVDEYIRDVLNPFNIPISLAIEAGVDLEGRQ